MRYIFRLLVLFLPFGVIAQDKGVHFEHGLSWKEVQAKAKAENKYIFMDCYTTWCGPCRYMANTVFPQQEMGDYFNARFVSVKVQMDHTTRDNDEVKGWYPDAADIEKSYGISAYPTFLYFSPDGKLVHRVVGGSEAKEFITRSADALDPEKQYYTQLEKFNKSSTKDPEAIRKMALFAKDAYDPANSKALADQYIATQKDLLTKENIEFLNGFTNSSKDKGFAVFMQHPDKVDAILGKAVAADKLVRIITAEDIYPKIPHEGSPDMAAIQAALAKKYPAYADRAMTRFKVQYYQSKNDWTNFQQEVVKYMNKYGGGITNPEELNTFAWTVFENCPDMTCVGEALEWSRRSFKDNNNPMFMDTYANILYKMGKKGEAIEWEQKAVALASGDDKAPLQENLDKMNKGEKTWKN